MAKQKYTIIDSEDNFVGFMVLDPPTPAELQHNIGLIQDTGPLHEAGLFLAVLTGLTGTAWLAGGPDWLAPTVGISLASILAGIRVWRSLPPEEPELEESAETITIKVEAWDKENNRVLLNEIEDRTIAWDDWRMVARAIITDGENFSRPALCRAAKISQTTYHKIKSEFIRLNFAHRNGNGYTLSPRAMAFLRKINGL